MSMLETVKTRRSVRTFDGNLLTQADQEKLAAYIRTIQNPYEIPVEFVLLDAKANGLSSPVLAGDTMYVAAKVGVQSHAEEAFGYSFEKLVLYAWSLGIGTTWIGGTMKRELFEKAAALKDHEIMPCMSPLGYPAKKMSVRELMMRRGVKADERKPASGLFFDRAFSAPLKEEDSTVEQALEMVRYAPSAVNRITVEPSFSSAVIFVKTSASNGSCTGTSTIPARSSRSVVLSLIFMPATLR